jgi:hypothetical protein
MFPKRSVHFDMGFDAYENKLTVGDCPHKYGTMERTEWLLGYIEAKQIQRQFEAGLGAVSVTSPAAK